MIRRPDVLTCAPASAADLHLRPAGEDDAFLLWFWNNDAAARRNSMDPQPVSWSAHEESLRELLKSSVKRVWLGEFRGAPAAQIRYCRVEPATANIHLYVLPRLRNRGIGTWLLDSTADLAGAALGVSRVRVMTPADNLACRAACLRAGFSAIEKPQIGGRPWLIFQRRCVFELTRELAVEL
jgi:RimJ/RimL family protein N-acetyltransferase